MTRHAFRGFLVTLAATASVAAFGGETGRIHWKSVPIAQVKLGDKTPLAWNVYQPDKKKESNLVLILLGHRYLALDIKAKQVFAVPFADLQKAGNDFESNNPAVPAHLIPTSDWSMHDVGPVELIKLTLGDYGRVLTVEMPHPPDTRAFY
jgi:hypothetical protein